MLSVSSSLERWLKLSDHVFEKVGVKKGRAHVLPATKPEYTLLVRRNCRDRAAVVEFQFRGGKYRVRSAYTLDRGQLEQK